MSDHHTHELTSEEIEALHEQCKSCNHHFKPKNFSKAGMISSPCFLCLFNVEMIKTNNYEPSKVLSIA